MDFAGVAEAKVVAVWHEERPRAVQCRLLLELVHQ